LKFSVHLQLVVIAKNVEIFFMFLAVTAISVCQAKNGENLKKGENAMPSFCGYGLCSESAGKSALHSQTAQFIAVVAQNLPEISSDIMQHWIENPQLLQRVLERALLVFPPTCLGGEGHPAQGSRGEPAHW